MKLKKISFSAKLNAQHKEINPPELRLTTFNSFQRTIQNPGCVILQGGLIRRCNEYSFRGS
jgi:hypothetical protein